MIVDFNQTHAEAELQADVCIIGAGAAGITIAREFIDSGFSVILLESGGLEFEQQTQDLYEGEIGGLPYDLTANRLRFFGGTTNHWGGLCAPLDDIDFVSRSWVANSGWPIARDKLVTFYKRAHEVCRVGQFLYGNDVWRHTEIRRVNFDPAKLEYIFKTLNLPPLRFGDAYADHLKKASNVQVFLHANVVNIHQSDDGRRVAHVDVRSLQGKSGRISARYFVLACGALENARLLLVSNSQEAAGVGNRNDVVGRYFIEHPQFWVGLVFPKAGKILRANFAPIFIEGIRLVQHLRATPEFQRRNRILNSIIFLEEILKPDTGIAAARDIMQALRDNSKNFNNLDEKVWRILMDIDEVGVNAWRRFILGRSTLPPVERIELQVESEQVPDADSRVTLTANRDVLGLNRLRLKWVMSGQETQTAITLANLLAAEFGRLGLGRVKLDEEIRYGKDPSNPHCYCHQMGTTRMAENPKNGVVDPNCRVHGLENIYIAGSSVFPTGGAVNPTLTIVALALRMSDQLKAKLR